MSSQPRLARTRTRGGFSLIELMIVVAITGVLAAIAIPTMIAYIQRSRTSEAVQFLGVIKLRQEAYRAEFGSYAVCDGVGELDNIVFVPGDASVMRDARSVAWPDPDCFRSIGAKPDGPVRFGYGWAAGNPGTMDADTRTLYQIDVTDDDHWFVAQAVTDLDNDRRVLTMEVTSFRRTLWVSEAAGWE